MQCIRNSSFFQSRQLCLTESHTNPALHACFSFKAQVCSAETHKPSNAFVTRSSCLQSPQLHAGKSHTNPALHSCSSFKAQLCAVKSHTCNAFITLAAFKAARSVQLSHAQAQHYIHDSAFKAQLCSAKSHTCTMHS